MEVLVPALLLLLVLLVAVWVLLLWKGLDPVRLLRSSFKSPRHYLTPGSHAEREKLIAAAQAAPPSLRTGQTLLYSDSVASLDASETTAETEEILHFIHVQRLVNTDVKAQHFAQHCQRKLRVTDLSAASVSTIVSCLQRYAHFRAVSECIQHCFTATHGAECMALKQEVEHHLCLFRLMYHYISFPDIRTAILDHFEQEARVLTATTEFVRPTKLLCDIDDTLFSVLFDTRYPELTVYPGVHQFVEEVLSVNQPSATGPASQEAVKPSQALHKVLRGPRIGFLTARPEMLRKRSMRELRECGFFRFSLLMGRLASAVMGPTRIAAGKLENFENYKRIFPEHQFIFVGDNGQGDIDLGKELLEHPERYGVSVVLIHDVVRNHVRLPNVSSTSSAIQPYRRNECMEHGIHSFRTYISATWHLYLLGMVDESSVVRVIQKTTASHASISFESEGQHDKLAMEIARDIALVARALPDLNTDALYDSMDSELRELVDVILQRHTDSMA